MDSLPDLTISQAGNPISGTMLKLFCLSINGVTSLIGKAPVCETGRISVRVRCFTQRLILIEKEKKKSIVKIVIETKSQFFFFFLVKKYKNISDFNLNTYIYG